MTQRPPLHYVTSVATEETDFTCPHCGALQAVTGLRNVMGALTITAIRCQRCSDIQVSAQVYRSINGVSIPEERLVLLPAGQERSSKAFDYAPLDALRAYQDACYLRPLHLGASGAYVRRALELILEALGYDKPVLAQSIEKAAKEQDPDRRLRKSLLTRLDYVKETGNFALHVRRDGELAIVDVSEDEVDFCLETIEELIETCFEEPERDRQKLLAMNEKLVSAGKKPIAVPEPIGTVALEAPPLEPGSPLDSQGG